MHRPSPPLVSAPSAVAASASPAQLAGSRLEADVSALLNTLAAAFNQLTTTANTSVRQSHTRHTPLTASAAPASTSIERANASRAPAAVTTLTGC